MIVQHYMQLKQIHEIVHDIVVGSTWDQARSTTLHLWQSSYKVYQQEPNSRKPLRQESH
jgi:hypothetical protein